MAQAHPTEEHLAGYASGALSEGMTLLVASHLTYCPDCRATVRALEGVGAALLVEDPRASHIAAPSVDAVMARLDQAPATGVLPADPGSPLPAPIRRELGQPMDRIDWGFRLPGLHEVELSGFEGERVSLLRVRPGTQMLGHTHDGEEATLVLAGQMVDGEQVFRTGDVALADESHDHNPRVTGGEVCYCLIVMTGNVRFTGPVGRALNLLAR